MKISIITICKNSEKYIANAIESVLLQSYKDIEYIIIDGDSQDKTKEIVSRYSASIAKFVSEPDRGVYEAMNKGIKLASGEFIYFLNSDDYLIDKDVIQDVVTFISSHSDCDIVYGNIDVRQEYDQAAISITYPDSEALLEHLIMDFICHQAIFARASLFTKEAFFDEQYTYAADYDWLLKMLHAERRFLHFSRTIVSYYLGGISGNIANQKASRAEIFTIQNQNPVYQDTYWLNQRILKFQKTILDNTYQVAYFQKLEMQLKESQDAIIAMKTSKFWKIRSIWFKFKKIIGLPIK